MINAFETGFGAFVIRESGFPFVPYEIPVILPAFQRLLLLRLHPPYLFFFFFLSFRHLFDSSHRETYESAHSVILSIFASHAQRTGTSISDSSNQTSSPTTVAAPKFVRNSPSSSSSKTTRLLSGVPNAGDEHEHASEDERAFTDSHREVEEDSVNFVKRGVPFYAQCLIEVGVFFLFVERSS